MAVTLKSESKASIANLLEAAADQVLNDELRMYPTRFLGRWILQEKWGMSIDNVDVEIVMRATTDACEEEIGGS